MSPDLPSQSRPRAVDVLIDTIGGGVTGDSEAGKNNVGIVYHLFRDEKEIVSTLVSTGAASFRIPMSFLYIDQPVAGKHTYKLAVSLQNQHPGLSSLQACQFFAWQMH